MVLTYGIPPEFRGVVCDTITRGPLLFFVHEEYLGAVDMTPHVGTIPTAGLASYFLV